MTKIIEGPDALTIGGFAKAAGVGVEAVRFYQRVGVLKAPPRPYGGVRRYGSAEVARIRFVKSAQRLGFTLDEVRELLRLDDGAHCAQARSLAERKLEDVRRRLQDLALIESVLADLAARCGKGAGKVRCPLIASLHGAA